MTCITMNQIILIPFPSDNTYRYSTSWFGPEPPQFMVVWSFLRVRGFDIARRIRASGEVLTDGLPSINMSKLNGSDFRLVERAKKCLQAVQRKAISQRYTTTGVLHD
jgi:hypothetical protein